MTKAATAAVKKVQKAAAAPEAAPAKKTMKKGKAKKATAAPEAAPAKKAMMGHLQALEARVTKIQKELERIQEQRGLEGMRPRSEGLRFLFLLSVIRPAAAMHQPCSTAVQQRIRSHA